MHSIRIIGPGRAGTSLAAALSTRGWDFAGFRGRHDDIADAARGVDVLVIATPDDAVAEVAATVIPEPTTTVVHLSGSLGLDALAPHPRRARCPPARPAAQRGGRGGPPRLRGHLRRGRRARGTRDGASAWAAGSSKWPTRTAPPTTPPPASPPTTSWRCSARSSAWPPRSGSTSTSFLPLTRAAVDDVASLGARAALTGPARRGDWATLSRHLDALPEEERSAYQAGAALATRLAASDGAQTVTPDEPVPAVPATV